MLTASVTIDKTIIKMYGTGYPAMAMMPDHIERMLQKMSKLSINNTFIIANIFVLHCFFISDLPRLDIVIITEVTKYVVKLQKNCTNSCTIWGNVIRLIEDFWILYRSNYEKI